MNKEFPKVLVISNDCLSNSTSNGRTLKNFFIGWPKNNIAQFCIHYDNPDYNVCNNYYVVSDRNALDSFLMKKKKNNILAKESTEKHSTKSRNALTMLIRNIVWNSKRWLTKDFYKWLYDYKPEIIVLQVGDSSFMFNIAMLVSKKIDIPIVVYNSESYFFKKYDYFRGNIISKMFYPVFYYNLKHGYKKLMNKCSYAIYLCRMLENEYNRVFSVDSSTIYTTTELNALPQIIDNEFKISYIGNLGLDRHKSLIEIANILQELSVDLKIDVYGRIPNDDIEKELKMCKGINICGFVDYKDVISVMQSSDLLLHIESFEKFYVKDLKYAFSTKIADCLGSGIPFLVYAPKELACTQYLLTNDCAHVATNKIELKKILALLINDFDYRNKYHFKATEIAGINHNKTSNFLKFKSILMKSIKNYEEIRHENNSN